MDIQIVLPFEGAGQKTPLWAREENEIDFQSEPERAARCTSAFAATELKHYLGRTLAGGAITFASRRPAQGCWIELRIAPHDHRPDGFVLSLEGAGLVITGFSRAGLLYGAYELLRLQGWRWYAPGKNGEIAPPPAGTLVLPGGAREHAPSFTLGRGFDFEYASMESVEMWLWMARNRLNVCAPRPTTAAFTRKLDMRPKTGGHIFEAILDPDRPMPSGITLWEEHPQWYGQPAGGERRKETALSTQFCVSQPDLVEFLAAEFLQRVTGPWREAVRVDVWGFDTWGNTCACESCRALGNSADQMLFFLSRLRDHLDAARRDGRLNRDVRLITCAYEGTATLSGPLKPIPHNLLAAGDGVVYYPINRCYAHSLDDPDCACNRAYYAAMASWFRQAPALPFTAAEYYNVSKYEDLPLLFTGHMRHDLPAYHALGARGLTYMHLPMVNWAMRALTQVLYAQLAWDVDTDVDAFLGEYFTNGYGSHGNDMRRAYVMIEQAWRYIADWRAWAPASILSQLLAWDGAPPTQPLQPTNHFATPADAVASARQSLAELRAAMAIVETCQANERLSSASQQAQAWSPQAVNPLQARATEQHSGYELRLGEDRRLLRYGMGIMGLMAECVAYHDALRRGDARAAGEAWEEIEHVTDTLDASFAPIGYEWPGPGLESKDALTRSQLREVLRRCRAARLSHGRSTLKPPKAELT